MEKKLSKKIGVVLAGVLVFSQLFIGKGWSADTENCTITVTIPEIYNLVLAHLTLSKTAVENDILGNGYIDLDQTSATCTANRGWKLSLNTTGFSGPSAKPVTDAQILTTGAYDTTYATRTAVAATATDIEVATDNSAVSTDVTTIDYRVLLSQSDTPGDYSITFTYTLASNV